jgi:hypothetical protein
MTDGVLDSLKTLRNQLVVSLEQLEDSIISAYENFKITHGADHFCIIRLESYYPAIEKQKEYIKELDRLIETQCYDNYAVVSAICATSEFIKSDAKSLLHLLQNGEELLPEGTVFH